MAEILDWTARPNATDLKEELEVDSEEVAVEDSEVNPEIQGTRLSSSAKTTRTPRRDLSEHSRARR